MLREIVPGGSWHLEGGHWPLGTVAHFEVRPDSLEKQTGREPMLRCSLRAGMEGW
jgi:hypothetical protein